MTQTATPRLAAPDPNQAWTRDDVAAFLQASTTSVDTLRTQDPTFPEPVQILSLIRWRPREVIHWFDGAEPQSASPVAKPARTVAPVAVPARGASRRG